MTSRTRRRSWAVGLIVLAIGLAASACGSSDKPEVCGTRDDLRSSVDTLLETNPAKDGLDEVRTRLADVRDSTTALASAAGDAYQPQVDTLQASTKRLGDDLAKLGSSPSSAGLSALVGDISAVRTDTTALIDAVGSACD